MQQHQYSLELIREAFRQRAPDAMDRAARLAGLWAKELDGMRRRGDDDQEALKGLLIDLYRSIERNKNRSTPRDYGPTPETSMRPSSRDSIFGLEQTNRITPDHVRAARDIQTIVERITSCVCPKGQSFERGSAGFRPGQAMSGDLAYRWSLEYVPWRRLLSERRDHRIVKIVDNVVLRNVSLDAARRDARASWDRGLQLLRDALDLWHDVRRRRDDERQRHVGGSESF